MNSHWKAAAVGIAAVLLLLILPGRAYAAESEDSRAVLAATACITLKQDGDIHEKFMDGNANGLFQPDTAITRAELAQILLNLMEDPPALTGAPSFSDVPQDAWFAPAVSTMAGLGIMAGGEDGLFRPNDPIPRWEVAAVLYRLLGAESSPSQSCFLDVPENHPAYIQISWAADQGLFQGDGSGNFNPGSGLTRAEAATVVNRLLGRSPGAVEQISTHLLRVFPDVPVTHWAYAQIMEATVAHSQEAGPYGAETWTTTRIERNSLADGFYRIGGQQYLVKDGCFLYNKNYGGVAFDRNGCATVSPGFHSLDGALYYADRYGNVVMGASFGAYQAGSTGMLTQVADAYQIPSVPYLSQIDNIYAWVGCEAVSALPGLWVKGYAQDVALKDFLDNLPRSTSDPELGFVGSPYVPDKTGKTRTTIYPAKLAEYSNSYCGGDAVCSDFRGATVEELRRELLAGNCVVAYETLWWKPPYYSTYNINGVSQRLVSNNHAVLVCGYDPEQGYFISDPYNYYNRGQVHQYWEDAQTFDAIWNERKVGMLIR